MMRIARLPGRPWLLDTAFWLLLIAATVAGGVAMYLARLDGQGTCNVPHATCPRAYATLGEAIALGGVSMMLLLAAVAVHLRRRRR